MTTDDNDDNDGPPSRSALVAVLALEAAAVVTALASSTSVDPGRTHLQDVGFVFGAFAVLAVLNLTLVSALWKGPTPTLARDDDDDLRVGRVSVGDSVARHRLDADHDGRVGVAEAAGAH